MMNDKILYLVLLAQRASAVVGSGMGMDPTLDFTGNAVDT